VERMVAAAQADVVIAPSYEPDVIEALQAKRKNTRILSASRPQVEKLQLRQLNGGFLVQDAHHFAATRADWRVVTTRQPTEAEWADAELAWRICGWVKSNSIVLVKDGTAYGIGVGLGTILVGDDGASASYVAKKHTTSEEVGIQSHHIDIAAGDQKGLMDAVRRFNEDPAVTGYLIQNPTPGCDFNTALEAMDPEK